MSGTSQQGPQWADVWDAVAELERRTGRVPELRVWPPRPKKDGTPTQPAVGVTVELGPQGRSKPRTRMAYIGGTRGARTFPAAFHRAVSELHWSIDDDEQAAAVQASF